MKLVKFIVVMASWLMLSSTTIAGVYKCKDAAGNTTYQPSPCAEENEAHQLDLRTGGHTDLAIEQKKRQADLELNEQQQEEKQRLIEAETKRKADTIEQSALNQQVIKENSKQYSAYAIPPYIPGKLPALVEQYKNRLPEIEKFRRLAAQKALATGECNRVEVDELSIKSKSNLLVISVDCSTGKTFYFTETELVE